MVIRFSRVTFTRLEPFDLVVFMDSLVSFSTGFWQQFGFSSGVSTNLQTLGAVLV